MSEKKQETKNYILTILDVTMQNILYRGKYEVTPDKMNEIMTSISHGLSQEFLYTGESIIRTNLIGVARYAEEK